MTKDKFLDDLKENLLLSIDPIAWTEKYLRIESPTSKDGKFDFSDAWKPFVDIYRYAGMKAIEKGAKPMIIDKSRQTGGSTMANVIELFFMDNFGKNNSSMRVIHIFPTKHIAETFSKTKFMPMVESSLLIPSAKKNEKVSYLSTKYSRESSIYLKNFANGNHIFIEYTGITGERLRGKTVDVAIFDEVQDMSADAIANSTKMLNQSNWGKIKDGVQIYFGTPKRKGSVFHKMWLSSNMQYYYFGCEKCKEYFSFYEYGSNNWEKIWIKDFIVECTNCGHQQDKRTAAARGKWIASKDSEASKFVGFHINQLYMPHITKEMVLDEKPENSATNSERAYRNEVLGEFYDGDSTPITIEEIIRVCGVPERKFIKTIPPKQKQVYMGIDFGGRANMEKSANQENKKFQGKSYTTAVVLVEEHPGLFYIAFACKFDDNTFQGKKKLIDKLMTTYSVNLCVADIGYAGDICEELNIRYGNRFIASNALGRMNNHIAYEEDYIPPTIKFDKDFYYEEMIQQLKNGQVKFPLGSYSNDENDNDHKGSTYDSIYWLMEHCENVESKPVNINGIMQQKYVKAGNTDGFAALLNAYLAYKFIATNGFSESLIANREALKDGGKKASVLGAYLPFM